MFCFVSIRPFAPHLGSTGKSSKLKGRSLQSQSSMLVLWARGLGSLALRLLFRCFSLGFGMFLAWSAWKLSFLRWNHSESRTLQKLCDRSTSTSYSTARYTSLLFCLGVGLTVWGPLWVGQGSCSGHWQHLPDHLLEEWLLHGEMGFLDTR